METLEGIKVYKCEHCNKISLSKGAMAMHEPHCKKNPNNKPICDDCFWLKYTDETQKFTVHFDYASRQTYDIQKRPCPFLGNLYFKIHGTLEDIVVNDEGWSKMPTQTQGCKHFVSAETAKEISEWMANGEEWFIFLEVTPRDAYDYFMSKGEEKEAEKYIINE